MDMSWKEIGEIFMKKMFEKDWKKLTQKQWEKMEWTEIEEDKFREWALTYLRKKGVPKYIAEKEVGWFMLQYAPKMKEKEIEK